MVCTCGAAGRSYFFCEVHTKTHDYVVIIKVPNWMGFTLLWVLQATGWAWVSWTLSLHVSFFFKLVKVVSSNRNWMALVMTVRQENPRKSPSPPPMAATMEAPSWMKYCSWVVSTAVWKCTNRWRANASSNSSTLVRNRNTQGYNVKGG